MTMTGGDGERLSPAATEERGSGSGTRIGIEDRKSAGSGMFGNIANVRSLQSFASLFRRPKKAAGPDDGDASAWKENDEFRNKGII